MVERLILLLPNWFIFWTNCSLQQQEENKYQAFYNHLWANTSVNAYNSLLIYVQEYSLVVLYAFGVKVIWLKRCKYVYWNTTIFKRTAGQNKCFILTKKNMNIILNFFTSKIQLLWKSWITLCLYICLFVYLIIQFPNMTEILIWTVFSHMTFMYGIALWPFSYLTS